MDFRDAATTLINEFCFKAQSGEMSAGELDEAEAATLLALYDAAKRDSSTAISGIARGLYWVLNPLATVPASYYVDSNFEKLAMRISELLEGARQGSSDTTDHTLSPENALAEDDFDAIEVPDFDERPTETVPPRNELEAIQQVLVDFAGELTSLFTIKPELYGREQELIAGPTREAAEKLIELWSGFAAARAKGTENGFVVPESWALAVANALYDCLLEGSATIYWASERRREAVEASADKIRAKAQEIIADSLPMNQNEVGVVDAIYEMMVSEDFKRFMPALTSDILVQLKSILINAVSRLLSGVDLGEVRRSAPDIGLRQEVKQREPWMMPWSVARKIVDELCIIADDETAMMGSFRYWFGLNVGSAEELKNELASHIVIIGREKAPEPEDVAEERSGRSIHFVYQNYRGEIGVREAVPIRLSFSSNEWHKETQWLLEAFDVKQEAMRTFAVKDIIKFLDGK
jgi:hypothetical protein